MNIHEVKKLYLEGYSLNKLGVKFGKDPRTIKRSLIKEGVAIRSRSEQNILTNQERGKKVDHSYFDEINSNRKAYILGFLAADGSITDKNRNSIRLGLSSVDRGILEKIKEEIQIEREIKDFTTNDGYNVSSLTWSSANHKIKLSQFDIVPNKTFKKISMSKIPVEFKFSYLLGYYDGDGCFRSSGTTCRFEICSCRPELLQEFALLINNKFGSDIKVNKAKSRDNYYTITYNTKYAEQLLDYLYSENDLFLKRKYDSYNKWKNSNSKI